MTRLVRPVWLLGALLFGLTAFVGYTFWRASNVTNETAAAVRGAGDLRFLSRALTGSGNAAAEYYASAGAFRDAAVYQGKLWAITPDTLWESTESGELRPRFRSGRELPSAPLTTMAVAALPGRDAELWIGTLGEGVVVFDGRELWQLLPQENAARKVAAVLGLSTGQVLLGTGGAGVLAWDGSRLTRFHDALLGLTVSALGGTFDDLWIGTRDRGVAHWKAGESTWFSEGSGLPDKQVLSLAVDGGRAFAGTSLGVGEFRDGKPRRTLAEGSFVTAMAVQGDRLLAGTMEEGIAQIPLEGRAARITAGLEAREVRRILSAGEGTYVVYRDGIALDGRPLVVAGDSLLADGNIAALAVEASGKLWVGYFDHGLDVVEPGQGQALHREDDVVFCVNRVVPRRDGAVIATANGLVEADGAGRTRRVLTRKDGLIASHVTDIVMEDDRMILATPAGLTFLEPGGPQNLYAFHGLVNNHVYALARGGGRLLAGTLGGVSVLEGGVVKASYTTANSALRQNWISALDVFEGSFYAGTYGAGVYRLDGTTWVGYPDGAFVVNPGALAAGAGALYAGTLEQGLAVLDGGRARWRYVTAGLPSKNVTAVAVAGGFVYVGTENGLVRIPERSLP
ncbi:MAG: PQQ-binding-like beta-propeller repeat protein [Bryobacterales bacterium]|nr:PQQ-binding-like beta-propeller repeat protein [Bryobacterales bacterium]